MPTCAIGRGLMAKPGIMLLDEPFMALAPLLVEQNFKIMKCLNEQEKGGMVLADPTTPRCRHIGTKKVCTDTQFLVQFCVALPCQKV